MLVQSPSIERRPIHREKLFFRSDLLKGGEPVVR